MIGRVATSDLDSDAKGGGQIERADGLRLVRFEQARTGLDLAPPLRRALASEGDTVTFQDRSVHVASWAKRFQCNSRGTTRLFHE